MAAKERLQAQIPILYDLRFSPVSYFRVAIHSSGESGASAVGTGVVWL